VDAGLRVPADDLAALDRLAAGAAFPEALVSVETIVGQLRNLKKKFIAMQIQASTWCGPATSPSSCAALRR
jgi:hypothetical protein